MCIIISLAAQKGHIETISWIFDTHILQSAQCDLQRCAFLGACQGQQIDMIKNYKLCTSIDIYVIHEAIISSGNNLSVIKEILDHYTVNKGELLDIARDCGNDILADWLIYGAPNSMLEL
jgi:NAD-dependent DNA ligase